MAGITLGTAALVNFGKKAIEVASDLTEVQNVVDVTFGSMANQVNEFASSATKEFGLSELSAKKFTSTMGAMLKSSGLTGQAVTDMSIEMAKLTADMASFYNLDAETAFQKIRSGISGETEPLKQLGINMSVANMEAYALSQGINTAWREMTQAEQTMLRYNYLLSVTGDAQGDFSRNTGTWANQVKLLKEQWQEFMGLMGEALIKILLPAVKFLNRVLDVLIKIANAIGQIYSMITGKEVKAESANNIAESNMDIADTAIDAADGEGKLADGIGKAAKAAKKALAPFDELNILQQNLGSGSAGSGLGDLFTPSKSEINTTIETKQVDDGLEETKKKWEGFLIWFGDKWTKLREMMEVPIQVPAPIFATIPDPIYRPNWGLELPPIKKPTFPPIPSPVYRPNWGLETPKVPAPVFPKIPVPVYEPVWNLVPPPVPAVDYSQYAFSLEEMKIRTAETFVRIQENIGIALETLNTNIGISYEWLKETTAGLLLELETDVATVMEKIDTNISTVLETIETNYGIHKENVATLATGIATALVTNINAGLSTMGANVNKTIGTVQNNLQIFGKNVGNIAVEIAKGFANNLSEGFKTASQNFATFANTVGSNLKAFGSGFLRASAETAKGFVSNMVSGFAKVWENFKNLMAGLGERVSGWFSANKEVITKTAITAGIVVGAGALALLAPAAIPYVAGALGGLATVPALAKGGITDGPMYALIGDNPGGKEVVSPLDTLQDMLVSAVGTAMMETNQFDKGNSQPIVVKTYLDGREVARAIYEPLEDEKGRRGDDNPVIQPI